MDEDALPGADGIDGTFSTVTYRAVKKGWGSTEVAPLQKRHGSCPLVSECPLVQFYIGNSPTRLRKGPLRTSPSVLSLFSWVLTKDDHILKRLWTKFPTMCLMLLRVEMTPQAVCLRSEL
jgi:hypothetical protein